MPRQYTPSVLRTCVQCGTEFRIYASQIRKGANRGSYCSTACLYESRRVDSSHVWDVRDRLAHQGAPMQH
jgi:hypothetical protein